MELPKLSTGQIIGGSAIAALGVGVGTAAVIRHYRKKNRKRKASKNKSSRKRVSRHHRKLKFGSKAYRRKYLKHGRRTPHTAGKLQDRSRKRIRYTSRGQPYVIGAHGKAKFISRKSAKLSYKREGGKY